MRWLIAFLVFFDSIFDSVHISDHQRSWNALRSYERPDSSRTAAPKRRWGRFWGNSRWDH